MSEPLQRVLRANQPLTLAGVPTGFLPSLSADLARAAHGSGKGGRAVAIVADEAAMRALADTVPSFAPEVQVLTLPAWSVVAGIAVFAVGVAWRAWVATVFADGLD